MGRAPRVPATAGWPPEGVPAAHTPRQQKPMRTTRLHLRKPWGVSRHRHSGRQAGTDPVKLSARRAKLAGPQAHALQKREPREDTTEGDTAVAPRVSDSR